MFFISKRSRARFFNGSQLTFFVEKECVDIIIKIRRGVYLTVQVYSLSGDRFLLACNWGVYWNRLKKMRNRQVVLSRLKKKCPLAANIFTNTISPHFVYLDKEQTNGAVVVEMKAPVITNNVSDYLHESVVEKAFDLMNYNLNLQVELEEKCPFPQWKVDLKELIK